jgi:polyphenol oxidase
MHMLEQTDGHISLLQFEHFAAESRLTHAFASKPCNFAPHRGRGRELAIEHRQAVCRTLGVPFDNLTSPEQVMAAEVLRVLPSDVGRGRDGRGSAVRFVDGLMTDMPGVPLVLMSADCPLIAAFDPDRPAIGAVHAGWQGTLAGAVGNLIRQMQREFGSRPERLLAGICPSAGGCCYEVGDEVQRIADTRMPGAAVVARREGGGAYLDMWTANRAQLLDAGVTPEHIEVAGLCTICNERFWSHRRDGAESGRSALFISLR